MNIKSVVVLLIVCFMTIGVRAQNSVYTISINALNGSQYNLSNYTTDTLLIVLLPVKKASTEIAFLNRIDSITLAHSGTLKTIAIPSIEDGYKQDSTNTLINMYQQYLDTGIIVAQPVYTHKSSGQQQNQLFQWLTHANQNGHFNDEEPGVGSFYFIDTSGNLYAIFEPEARNSNKALNKVLL